MRNVYVSWGLAGALGLLAVISQPAQAEVPTTSVNDLSNPSLFTKDSPKSSQVNSVSELTDVDPNSWAFQALKNVVERYGCLEGYPNKTYKGNRPLSRYEFAAGLNACLEKVNELITASTSNLATKEDLAVLQRLAEEFRNELAALRGRVDFLEAKTKELESKLFSTTAKLDAEVIMSAEIQGADVNAFIRDSAGNLQLTGGGANVNSIARTRLNIRANSLITRGDQLRIRLNGRTGDSTPFTSSQGRVARIDYAGAAGDTSPTGVAAVDFDKVYYDFPLSFFGGVDNVRIRFGPRIENIDLLGRNKYTVNEAQNFSWRNFRKDPLFIQIQESSHPGVHADIRFSRDFALRIFYAARDGGSAGGQAVNGQFPYGGSGLFGGSTQIAAEIGFRPTPSIDIGLGYSYLNVSSAGGSSGFIFGDASGAGGGDARLQYNAANVSNIGHNVFAAHVDWDITPGIAIFGRYSYDTANFYGRTGNPLNVGGSIDANTWMAGLALPDLFGKGNLFEAAIVQPIQISNNGVIGFVTGTTNPATDPRSNTQIFRGNIDPRTGLLSSTGLPYLRNGTEYDVSVAYRYRVTDRLSLTPEVLFVINPNGVNQQGITVGNLRATFEF
ncbi:iron uptake porin [Gloeobacter kilaueensis]|uniref:Carbohydrate-selective porin OprB n=1 Tax=Gloeobacter kilaueensis (strain ATCC BAA-2537 / CCAP 1431/1 / ULC 316 / JS1) TaxID=1183438 RepID=U5QFW7_GLOK1|nr:iron uptake porin [Gloeobacter kilaueensis]AGY57801.1 carbohydrate-selective porin OprB [Gloeobacter kilaueensis JS1]